MAKLKWNGSIKSNEELRQIAKLRKEIEDAWKNLSRFSGLIKMNC